jgi:uncharacterized protein YbjT (DUF2867 family)
LNAGYIGGAILSRLLELLGKTIKITILVRSPAKAKAFDKLHPYLQAVVGDLGDATTVERLAQNADVVINCVCGWFLSKMVTTLMGRKKGGFG